MANRRVYFACRALGIAAESSLTFTKAYGVQSAGGTTTFGLDAVFQLGMLDLYDQFENVPDVELTAEKVLDGNPLLYHLATQGATSADLAGRSNLRCNAALSIFTDTQSAASGNPLSQVYYSGMFVQQLSYKFSTEGPFTESVTFVGNNKTWKYSGFTFTGGFAATGSPYASEGVNRRQNFSYVTSRFPTTIRGISASGTVDAVGGVSNTVIQSVQTSVNLGRDQLFELSRFGPFFRYATFPVEVTTEIGILSKDGDGINCVETSTSNTSDQTIILKTQEGTKINLGTKNRLQSTQTSGGDATTGGNNNETITYRFRNYNAFTVTHPLDPTVALAE